MPQFTQLKEMFERAIENEVRYGAILVQMDGYPKNEVIINELENLPKKLEYIGDVYDAFLKHRKAAPVSIVGFAVANTYAEIEVLLVKHQIQKKGE